jgi:hypothetical protein
MKMPIYIDQNTGTATPTKWTDVCGQRDLIWITREQFRHVGRWGMVPRERVFAVWGYWPGHIVGRYKTLAAALAAAQRYADARAEAWAKYERQRNEGVTA